jgi:hypothetical protein
MRNSHKSAGFLATAALLLMMASPMAMAQATRTWVSGVGDDANPCSRTAPCKTFAGAISKTAAGGVISTLDPGGFGAVTITKSITIDGSAGGGILASLTNGIIVNAGANDTVSIINLNIDGGGNGLNGIRYLAGGTLNLYNVKIDGFNGNGDVNQGRGVIINPTAGALRLHAQGLIVTRSNGGILSAPTGTATVEGDIHNANIAGNTNGIRITDRSSFSVHDSVVTGSKSNGIVVFTTTQAAFLNLLRTELTSNGLTTPTAAGISIEGPFSTGFISNAFITDNPTGFRAQTGGSLVSFNNNAVFGNLVDGTATSFLTGR